MKLNSILLTTIASAGLITAAWGAKYITIGTGGVTGVYYPTGGAIAKMINKKKRTYGLRASVESTAGSVFNINSVLSGDLEFGIAQSDRQYQAVQGLAEWKSKGPQKDLRAVFSLHSEAITLIAAADANIKTIQDLKGKRVNIGNPGSGQRQNAIDVLTAAGIDFNKDLQAESLKAAEAPKMLQDNRIDAFFYTVGHPNGNITEATSGKRKVNFVSITGMDSLLKKYPYYAPATIKHDLYPMAQNKAAIPTIGVKATFVTSAKMDQKVVYAVTKELFENLDEFKKLHPAFGQLEPAQMLKALSAPLHPGASLYFKEKGLSASK